MPAKESPACHPLFFQEPSGSDLAYKKIVFLAAHACQPDRCQSVFSVTAPLASRLAPRQILQVSHCPFEIGPAYPDFVRRKEQLFQCGRRDPLINPSQCPNQRRRLNNWTYRHSGARSLYGAKISRKSKIIGVYQSCLLFFCHQSLLWALPSTKGRCALAICQLAIL